MPQRLSCYIYREGKDFHISGQMAEMKPDICEFAVIDNDEISPNPELFKAVQNPDEAQVFLFPLSIGQYIDTGAYAETSAMIDKLPYLAGRENRHLVFDNGDLTYALNAPVCLFKYSVTNTIAEQAVPIWYDTPAHVLADQPEFNPASIRYDCSFVGVYSNVIRKAATISIQHDTPELRFFLKGDDSIVIKNDFFLLPKYDAETRKKRQQIFCKSIKESLTVLCLPGIGPQSIRLYETMYYGRIPIIISKDIVYPFTDKIDYSAFCLILEPEEVMHAGKIIKAWLKQHSQEELWQKCALACKTWNKYFAPEKRLRLILKEGQKKFGF